MSDELKQPRMNKFRAMIWPVYKFELKKFLPMSLMMICILFVYTLCRDLKDSLIMACPGTSAAVLSWLKVVWVLPSSVLFTVVFMKLANKFNSAQMFYGTISFFVLFFLAFGFVLYPNTPVLHGSLETLTGLQEKYDLLRWFWPTVTYWTFSLAYVLSELWGTAAISLLFWQFANETTRTTEAKRFYSFYGMLGNLGLIASGKIVQYFSGRGEGEGLGDFEAFGTSLKWQMFFVAVSGVVSMAVYYWMQKNVLTDPKLYTPEDITKKKAKPKMGVGESLKFIVSNPYVMLIAMLILTYGISINLDEVLWKQQIKALYPVRSEYNKFMGGVSVRTGYITVPLMLIGTNILRKCKWRTAALVTPVFMIVTSILFFGLLIYKEKVGNDTLVNLFILKNSALYASVYVGMYQVASSKGIKYSLFDATKNMAYLPLDSETKLKSQAAVEVIGGRLGKSGGALITMLLTSVIFKGADVTHPIVMRSMMVLALVAMGLLVVAVLRINPKVVKKLEEKHAEEEAMAKAAATK